MTDRTIQFCGYGYGDVPVQINAHINGNTVFSGAVPTLDQPMPDPSINMASAPVLFTVNSTLFPTEFSGSYPMTISVATGYGIVLGRTLSNYMLLVNETANVIIPGNATGFLNCYTGTPTNSEGTPDSRSSVTIDAVAQVPPLEASLGEWTWLVAQGSTLACNFNVSLGNVVS